ncbi:MAG: DNA-directed RNA polymerase subunit D [Candidatus Pacearchaeota archaeon]
MKIEKLSKTENKASFIVRGIRYSIANAIRRSVLEIPTLAIDTVEFYKNDSALYDEMLAHRLGLIPLTTPKNFTKRENCSCKGKGCLKCTAVMKLKTIGPKTVYASDLKNKGVEVVFKEMPIVILAKDQELEFIAEAVLGIGKQHAKHTPGLLWFNAYPIVKEMKQAEKPIKIPPQEFEKIKKSNLEACQDYINEIVESEGKFMKIETSPEDFVFYIESFGQLSAEEIFNEAINTLNENLDEFAKAVKKEK